MSEKTDRRVRRTRAQMRAGLARLMQKKSIKEITVKELVEEADINRSTFYLHYTDIYAMLEAIEDELDDEIQTAIREYPLDPIHQDSSYPFIARMFSILEENKDICAALLSPNGDMKFVNRIEVLLTDTVLKKLSEQFPKHIRDIRYVYAYCIHGCMGIVRTWLSDDTGGTPEHMADLTAQLIVNTAHTYLERMSGLPEHTQTVF